MKRVLFLDLDETIYPGLTIKDTARWLLGHGYLSKWAYLKILWWLFLRSIGRLDHEQAFRGGAELLAGYEVGRLEGAIETAYEQFLKPKIAPKICQQIAAWRKEYRLVLATESLAPIAEIFATDLGIVDILATELEIEHGRVTGRLTSPPLFGTEKVAAMQRWAQAEGVDLGQATAVGGRIDDRPMLEAVGKAIVLNPDGALADVATKRGWKIITISTTSQNSNSK